MDFRWFAVPSRLARVFGAAGLVGYCAVLEERVRLGGPGHIGDDIVVLAYLLSGLLVSLTLAELLWLRLDGRRWRVGLGTLVAMAVASWLCLHLGGFVYSHSSMFAPST